jgi:ABC-type polysaccharide/polyol phosphate transport system ATPase subunit
MQSSGQQAEAAIAVSGLQKSFRIPHEQVHTLKERALHPLRRTTFRELHALNDVSFDVKQGEFFGVVGRNGSGKSTLMKCLAGIYRADDGEIWARGRMATFIELGVGFNPDLTARDNALLNATMLGLTPAEARRRYEEIVRFAELEDFEDLKLKNYSAGMHVRLAFSVMAHVDAEVLLIDEVLAVGDASFQQKCHDALNGLRDRGKTILLVTHDMNAVQRFCDRAMLLEQGSVVAVDEPERVSRRYNQINFERKTAPDRAASAHSGDGGAAILDAWFEDGEGVRKDALPHDEPCAIRLQVEFRRAVEDPVFGVVITDEQHRMVFAVSSAWSIGRTGTFAAGERVELAMRFQNVLARGRYFASPEVAYDGTGQRLMDHREDLATVVVSTGRQGAGVVDLPHEMEVTRIEEPAAQPAGRP